MQNLNSQFSATVGRADNSHLLLRHVVMNEYKF